MNVISFNPTEDERNVTSYRHERHFDSSISVTDRATCEEIARAWFYRPGDTVYCVVWIWSDRPARGCGKAGGGGYHKHSAALGEALSRAGVTLSKPIDGCGASAMNEALLALARHMGVTRPLVVRAMRDHP